MKVQMKEQTSSKVRYSEIIQHLSHGIEAFISDLRSIPKTNLQLYYIEIENIHHFLETFGFIQETMSGERLRDTLHNTIRSIQKAVKDIPNNVLSQLSKTSLDSKTGLPSFLLNSLQQLGPSIRISNNEMSAWILLDRDESNFFNPEILRNCLINQGITEGILDDRILSLFEEKTFDEEICIAEGKPPTLGENGRIDYTVEFDDLSHKPQEINWYRVSFKDIKLYEFVRAGDAVAKKIPPKPGIAGFTVTGRNLPPLEAHEAVFPELKHATVSDDGNCLLATEDCCIKKQFGTLQLEPSLHISESVSYKTGNVSSHVDIVVEKDVLTGFSIVTDKSIHVGGIVEGAKLEAQGNIVVRGGIQGKEKARIDSNGDISAKFISHATTCALGNTFVESEILNSDVWVGGQLFVTGHPGNIVGGEINTDSDISVNTIGSELGTKTVIRIGDRTEKLAVMIRETQDRIAEQEDAVDKCNEIIDALQMRASQTAIPDKEVERSIAQAKEMLFKAKQNLESLYLENDGIQKQYEDSIQKSRTIRARTNIFPGTVIAIQAIEFTVKIPTGPAIFLKQGGEIVQLPYQELKK